MKYEKKILQELVEIAKNKGANVFVSTLSVAQPISYVYIEYKGRLMYVQIHYDGLLYMSPFNVLNDGDGIPYPYGAGMLDEWVQRCKKITLKEYINSRKPPMNRYNYKKI